MQLSIIIPTKERDIIFSETLKAAINATNHLLAEIIVVNDSCISSPLIPKEALNITLLRNPKQGVASARNFGAKEASGDLLLFLDNDIIISQTSVNQIINLHSMHQKSCFNLDWSYPILVQKKLENSSFGRFIGTHGMNSFKGWYNDHGWKDKELFKSTSVASFHLSISRADFIMSGGYDERFPYAGFEDHDFPMKLKELGISFYIDARVKVEHNESDRLNLDNWLTNQERRAASRKVGVILGYEELRLNYSFFKKILLYTMNILSPIIRAILAIYPNHKFFDPIYFKLLALVQAARIFKGYSTIRNEDIIKSKATKLF